MSLPNYLTCFSRTVLMAVVPVIAVLVAAAPAPAADAAPLAPEVQWKDPSEVRLEVDFPGEGYHASWQLFRCTCGDLLVRSELNVPGEQVHGDVLLVANRAVLIRGYEPEAAEQISIDAPALMMQLALRLLERAEPAGPAAISGPRDIAVQDDANPILLDSGDVVGGFPAPWRVVGSIAPVGDSERRFDLRFSFSTGAGSESEGAMRLTGVADYRAKPFPLTADTDLTGWTTSWRNEQDSAGMAGEEITTLGALRERLRAIQSR